MAFAIVGYFDKNSDDRIKSLWKLLAENNICDYLYTSQNSPHIKFSTYADLDLDNTIHTLSEFVPMHDRFDIHFKNYGFYPNKKPIIFLDTSASNHILNFQIEINETIKKFGKKFDFDYFDPGIWKPDCFLTIGIDKNKLPKAISLLGGTHLSFNGIMESIGIIEFHPAKKIIEFPLN